MKWIISAISFFFRLFCPVLVADARSGHGGKVFLDSEDISNSCYHAEAYFDGRFILAYCYMQDSGGRFLVDESGDGVLKELRIGLGRIVPA